MSEQKNFDDISIEELHAKLASYSPDEVTKLLEEVRNEAKNILLSEWDSRKLTAQDITFIKNQPFW